MANHKSALKRAKQNDLRRLRNKAVRTTVKNTIKELRAAATENSTKEAAEKLVSAKSIIDRAAKKGVIHKKNAARKISRLSRLVNSISD
ncbi:MAG: 30S ribosomal protein S20 [Desulfobacteraceae bacterium]|nr:30S ribosomal protein S20 [Desulfobacteraceae bacterium]